VGVFDDSYAFSDFVVETEFISNALFLAGVWKGRILG
jgi:hypothetical protein